MAEERNLGLARALDDTDEDQTKAELQRRMEEARESITQTVTEIKDTVANQYNYVKESVSDALDWREQYRKRPLVWNLSALGVGFVVGYGLAGIGDRDDRDYYEETEDSTDAQQSAFTDHRSYAAHAITGGAYGSSEYAAAPSASAPQAFTPPPPAPTRLSRVTDEEGAASRPSYSSGYDQAPVEEEDKPGLMERFKETRAYDRLQEEVSDLGNRFMDELSNAARTIVLPALFNKIKDLVGVDLSNKKGNGATTSRSAQRAAQTSTPQTSTPSPAASTAQSNAPTANASSSGSAGTGSSGTGGTGASMSAQGSSYGTNEAPGSKPNRLMDSRTATGGDGPGNSFGYDDRYERESQSFARSENRGFGQQGREEGGTGTTDPNRDDTPRGGNS